MDGFQNLAAAGRGGDPAAQAIDHPLPHLFAGHQARGGAPPRLGLGDILRIDRTDLCPDRISFEGGGKGGKEGSDLGVTHLSHLRKGSHSAADGCRRQRLFGRRDVQQLPTFRHGGDGIARLKGSGQCRRDTQYLAARG